MGTVFAEFLAVRARPSYFRIILFLIAGHFAVATTAVEAQRPIVIEIDNDALNVGVLGSPSDGEYSHGMRLFLPVGGRSPMGRWLFPDLAVCRGGERLDACQDWTLVLGHQIYTPGTNYKRFWPERRPFAGWLGASMHTGVHTERLDHQLTLALGVTGTPSLAEPVQRWFHDMLGEGTSRGWKGQLASEPTIGIAYRGALRPAEYRLGQSSTLRVRPTWCAGVGTVRTEVGAGLEGAIEFGAGGAAEWPGIEATRPTAPVYLLGGISGRMVAGDLFLDGGFFHQGPSVGHEPFVYVAEVGAGIHLQGRRIEWRVINTSRLYPTQPGPHTYTTIAIVQ